jgi:hypothetical protein
VSTSHGSGVNSSRAKADVERNVRDVKLTNGGFGSCSMPISVARLAGVN